MVLAILLSSVALLLVFEGLLPFLTPTLWRRTLLQIAKRSDQVIRITGLICLCLGTALMYWVHAVLVFKN